MPDNEKDCSEKRCERRPAIMIRLPDGTSQEVSFEQLALSNKFTLDALLRVLAKNNVLTTEEFIKEFEEIQKERIPQK